MATGRRYGTLFALLTAAIIVTVIWAHGGVAPADRRDRAISLSEGGDTFVVRDPALIRPAPESFEPFAAEDAAWRAEHARPMTVRELEAAGEFRPTPRQAQRDRVYLLVQAGRLEDAVTALEDWVAHHPEDTDATRELARLLVALDQPADAVPHYRLVLARTGRAGDRAELAAALLAAGNYRLAAHEYRLLVAGAPNDTAARLGLARALTWGEQWPDAERELSWLRARMPGDTTVLAMLRDVRLAMEPSADEAARWVADDPDFPPWRLALARALVRERRFDEALAQYDSVLARDGSLAMLREAAGAHAAAGDSLGNARLLARAVALAPADSALGAEYARALAWSGDRTAAIARWSRLIARHPDVAAFHFERGRLYAWSGDYARAEADLRRAAELEPTYETYALLGDVYRWRGDYRRARAAYGRALVLRPDDEVVLAGLAEVRRLERLAVASGPVQDERGWVSLTRYAEDNTGFLFISTGLARGFPIGSSMVFSLGGEQRYLAQRSWRDATRWVRGVAGSARLSYVNGRAALAAHAGLARHPMVDDIPTGGVSATLWWPAVRATFDLATGPVYTSLMTTHALVRFTPRSGVASSTTPLTGRSASGSVAIPIGQGEISVGGERVWLSDDNRRTSVNVGGRLPLGRHVSAIYHGNSIGYSARSDIYWDPHRYQSHSAGIEVAVRREAGLSFAARVMPGIARSAETFPLPADSTVRFDARNAMQLSAGGEVEYRRRQWSVSLGGGYGRGREGSYEALNGTLKVQLAW